jgi:hypothetical protein
LAQAKVSAKSHRSSTVTHSSQTGWDVSLRASNGSTLSITWKLVYRASLFGFGADDFHRACDGEGTYVVVVKAESGRIVDRIMTLFRGGSLDLKY